MDSKKSKQFAFVDLSSPEAAQLVINSWNNNRMKKYPNRLAVSKFNAQHQKITKEARAKENGPFTNLYVEKLPVAFNESDVFNLFEKYGTVCSVKIKKPDTNVQFYNINSLPCAAYVNY